MYPFPSEELSHLVENNKEGADAWVGQFVTPWASLQGNRLGSDDQNHN